MITENDSVNTEEDRPLLGVVVGAHAINRRFYPLLEQFGCSTFDKPVRKVMFSAFVLYR